MTWRPFSFEVVDHRQAFPSPCQNLSKSAVSDTVFPGRDAGSLAMNGLIGVLRLMSIMSVFLLLSVMLCSFCLFSQVDVCVGAVLICMYLTLFAVESWVWKPRSSDTSDASAIGSKKSTKKVLCFDDSKKLWASLILSEMLIDREVFNF